MSGNLQRLERLSALRASGALTDAEFEAEKAVLLANPTTSKVPPPIPRPARWLIVVPCAIVLLGGTYWLAKLHPADDAAGGDVASAGQAGAAATDAAEGQGQQPSAEYLKLCVFAEMVPTGFRLSTLTQAMRDQGRPVAWEKSGGNWQLHSNWRDQLTNENHTIAIEFIEPSGASPSAKCGGYPGDLLIARLAFDGQDVSRFAIGTTVQTTFGTIFGKDGAGPAPR